MKTINRSQDLGSEGCRARRDSGVTPNENFARLPEFQRHSCSAR